MQKTNKLKRLSAVMLAVVMVIACFAPAASALNVGEKVTYSHRLAYHGGMQSGESGNKAPGSRSTHYNNRLYWYEGWNIDVITLSGNSGLKAQYGGQSYAYCVQHKVSYGETNRYVEGNEDSIEQTAWWRTLTGNQRTLLRRALPHMFPAMTPSELGVSAVDDAYAASQVIVWEIIAGYRDANGRLTNATLRDQYMKYAYTGYGHTKGDNTPAMTAYKNIENGLISHSVVPSWNGQTVTLDWNETNQRYEKTITDANGVLGQFTIPSTVNGITLTRSGNNLTLSSKTAVTGSLSTRLWKALKTSENTGNIALFGGTAGKTAQKMIYGTLDDPVYFDFSVTTGNGTLRIKKTTAAGAGSVSGWTFVVRDINGVEVLRGVTNSSGYVSVNSSTYLTLPSGTYTVEEELTTTQAQTIIQQTPKTVTLKTGETSTVTFTNRVKTTDMRLFKYDGGIGQVEGIPFRLYRRVAGNAYQSFVYVAKTDANGEILFNSTTVTQYYKDMLTKYSNDATKAADAIFLEAYARLKSDGTPNISTVTQAIRDGWTQWGVAKAAVDIVKGGGSLQVVNGNYNVAELLWALPEETDGVKRSDWTGWIESWHEPTQTISVNTTSLDNNIQVANEAQRIWFAILKRAEETSGTAISSAAIVNDITFHIEQIDDNGDTIIDYGYFDTKRDSLEINGTTVLAEQDGVIAGVLSAGRYRVTEIVPDGYTVKDGAVKILNLHYDPDNPNSVYDSTTNVTYLTFSNIPTPVPVRVIKTLDEQDAVLGDSLANWSFTVSGTTFWGKTVYMTGLTTDANGYLDVSLYPGNYTVSEVLTTAQQSIYIQPSSQSITLDIGQSERQTLTFQNSRYKQPVQIVKTSDTGEVEGFCFSIIGRTTEGALVQLENLITDADGLIYAQLWPGSYTVTETLTTEQAKLYRQPAPQSLSITTGDAQNGTLKEVKFRNESIEVDLYVQKRAPNGNTAGFGFRVTGTDVLGRAVNLTGVTDESGVTSAIKLIPGTYTITEELTAAQAAIYAQPAPKTLTVTASTSSPMILTFENTVKTGSLKIIKTFEGRTTPIANVPFTVSGTIADGRTYRQTYYTDAKGEILISDMPIGEYVVEELASSLTEEYILSEAQTVTVAADKLTELTINNLLKQGSLTVQKLDGSGTPAAGAEYLLEKSTDGGSTWTAVTAADCTSIGLTNGRLVTGANGIVKFAGLKASADLQYRLTETKAPEGCTLLTKPVFEGSLPVTAAGKTLYHVSFAVTNHAVFDMPMTGGSGMLPVTLATVLAGLTLTAGGMWISRKRRA